MKQIYKDLWQTALEKPFTDLRTHAYYLKHNKGNILIYNTGDETELNEIDNMGGIHHQCLSHRHEDGASLKTIHEKFGNTLCADALEALYIKHQMVSVELTDKKELCSNFVAIPTPGHTNGGFSFFYCSPMGKKYLFTGDTFFQWNSRWSTLVLSNEGGNEERLIESLLKLRKLEPDIVLCSASVGEKSIVEVTQKEWHEAIDSNIRRLNKQIERGKHA